MQQPKWKENYRVERLKPDLVFLLSEREQNVLKGQTYYDMAPFLDGESSVEEIVRQVNGGSSFFSISQALARIEYKGYVVDRQKEHLSPDILLLCHSLNIDIQLASERIEQTKIFFHTFGDVSTNGLVERLVQAGVRVSQSADEADLCLVLTNDYLHPELDNFNQNQLEKGQPWLLAKPVGTKMLIGPLFQADETGCWVCLSQRFRLHQRVERFLQAQSEVNNQVNQMTVPTSSFAPLMEIGLSWTVMEVLKWILQGANDHLNNHVTTLDIYTRELQHHRFVKRPQCPSCGDGDMIIKRTQEPMVLQSQPKLFTVDGGHRVRSPEETVAALEHHISPVTGILQVLREAENDNSNGLIHSYFAGVNVQYTPHSYDGLRAMFKKSGDSGKGASPMQSKASGICEALERYSASYQGNEYAIKASYASLGEQAIHPNDCMIFSQQQYATAVEWNKRPNLENFNRIPPQFDENATTEWTPIWSLTEQRLKYLPTLYCYFGFHANKRISRSTPACSNGNAAGNTLEEAILQGFMELVERDGVALWWYNRVQRPSINLDSFENDYINRLQRYYDSLNRDIWALDITTDLNVPTFAAVSRSREKGNEKLIYGFGAHFDPQIAMLRALTEVNQCLSFLVIEDGQGASIVEGELGEWWDSATLENQPYLAPLSGETPIKRSDYNYQWRDDLYDDVMACVNGVGQQGMEMLVLDQTQPDVGLNVVKVFVPGLRHFRPRFGPGRLYDVPVKLGWLDKPVKEEDMNPFPIFF